MYPRLNCDVILGRLYPHARAKEVKRERKTENCSHAEFRVLSGMFALALLLLSLLYLIYKYYSNVNTYWKKKGIPGPEPELFFGNMQEIWEYEKPRSLVLRDWTKKYGKMYGYYEGVRKYLVVSDFEMLNEILIKKFDHFYARSRFELQRTEDGPKTHLVEARGTHWKRLRALGSHAFTNKSLKQIVPVVKESAMLAVDGMERAHEGEINTLEFFQEYTMDVISKIALGMKDAKMFHNEYVQICRDVFNRPLKHLIMVVPCVFPWAIDAWMTLLESTGKFLEIPFLKLMDNLEKAVAERKNQREGGSPSTGDFIDMFLDAEVDVSEVQFGESSDTARKLSFEEVVGQCLIFLLAGFDTTSISLSYVTHFLANYPEVQERLREEVDAFAHEDLDIEQLGELTYMECVIKESLRHYPLGTVAVTRECTKACEIKGYKFEEGDMVATDTWSLHMDKQIWGEDAEEFRPERWLEESTRARAAFQAFGEGPRMCIGMRLAYLEEKIALLELMKRFTIEKTEHTNPIRLVGSLTVGPEKVMVKLTNRNTKWN
ncbi:hypothetical protein PMAYCL1PPCAC_09036 [Pristionchus mayeri]|uniref:Cytochrome P450 n=1 Tax=Pristionchus mayeri TaxID=1317129 RepID=A0AAN5CEI9_9BILA|nr:hypothetical protein PMAYCL1PPCAC_09035 [Pristionchus mayeri]GMR38841.1 hypothetical protein PMAYCL1PPCAC_09036 [Pristionchus mayeri]